MSKAMSTHDRTRRFEGRERESEGMGLKIRCSRCIMKGCDASIALEADDAQKRIQNPSPVGRTDVLR